MRFTKAMLSSAFVMVFLGCSIPALFGQDRDKGSQKNEETVTGCLSKGTAQNEFMLKDQATGSEMEVKGSADLAPHSANHTVKLTGKRTTEGGKTVFDADKVEMISASCQPSKKG